MIPEWFTDEALRIVNSGKLLPGESISDAWLRISKTANKHLKISGFTNDLYEAFFKGYIGAATPVLANMGAGRGLPISCYALHVSDSLDSIGSHLKELIKLTQAGGGVGCYWNDIRASGLPISGGGEHDGFVRFALLYDRTVGAINQGGFRRGSATHGVSIEHPDVRQLLQAKDHKGGDPRGYIDGTIYITIPDRFMEKVINGDKEAKELFNLAQKTRLETGSPYLVFIDNINDQNPQSYKNNNLKVSGTNICCLTGDTKVSTKEGVFKIKNLIGKTVTINDGENWVENSNFYYAGKEKIIEVTLIDGSQIKMTPDHRNPTSKGIVLAKDLTLGHELKRTIGLPLKIMSIRRLGKEKVYCTTVPTTGQFGLANGILTGNSEITLYTDEDHTFVCCLSSLNLSKFDEWHNWKSPNLRMTVPELATYLLDATISEFIIRAKQINSMGRAIRSAEKGRAIGVGVMGWHDYLQQKNLPFGSNESKRLNKNIFKYIEEETSRASKDLATKYGEPLWCQGTGYRNTHRLACAPTKTNSKVTSAGSEGIEPYISNYFRAKDKINTTVKNRNLERLLESKGKNTFEIWESINSHLGSVLHLDFLSIEEKLVYLTAREIDQMDIVMQGCDRQKFVDQAISTNLFASPFTPLENLNEPVFYAWSNGLKTLYYLKSSSSNLIKKVSGRALMIGKDNCEWCMKAKDFLSKKDYEIEYHDLKNIKDGYFHWNTVPRIWLDGHYIGTYQDMVEYFNTKESKTNVKEQGVIESCESCEA